MTTPTTDLSKFCFPDGSRYAMSTTQVRSGFEYATDGAILVRVPTDAEESPEKCPVSERRYPNVKSVWDTAAKEFENEFAPWPDVDRIEEMSECPTCDGTGYSDYIDCENCEGTGYSCCPECGHEDDCDECHGSGFAGKTICGTCHGEKRFMQPVLQRIGSETEFVAVKYDDLIRGLPGPVMFRYVPEYQYVLFRFDGGEGIVMCRKGK